MKKVLNFGSLLLILNLLIASCGKDPKIEQQIGNLEQGRFALHLGTMGSFEVITRATDDVDVSDFTVHIKGTTLKENLYDSTWARYADMPSVITIPAGTYTISAYNGEQRSGFATPYYYGEKEFTVGIQELTDAQVTCQLACVKLSVEFTSLFLSNVNDPVCIIHQSEGVSLQFDPKENNGTGYIAVPADSTLAITIRGSYAEDGSEVNRTYFIKEVGAKQWHKIALSVNTSAGIENEGGGMIEVDHSVDEKNSTVLVPGAGDLIDNNGDYGSWEDDEQGGGETPDVDDKQLPTITGSNFNGKAFTFDQPLIITDADKDAGISLDITLKAPEGGIKNLYLVMSSTDKTVMDPTFAEMGATNEASPWDLANPQESIGQEALDILTQLNVINLENPIKGKKDFLFSIGGFMSFLTSPDDASLYFDHTFKIRMVDANDNEVSETFVVRRKN